MPRVARHLTHVPGALTHVIVRFVDGRFVLDDEARFHYLVLLERALRGSDWRLISYALMSSHVHLGCIMGAAELKSWVLSLHLRFAKWINRRSGEHNPKVLGHVIADRPHTNLICPSRARFLVAYQHRNPLEAGVVNDPAESTWTSHRAYLGLEPCRGGLDLSLGLELVGFEPSPEGRRDFHEFVSRNEVTLAALQSAEQAPLPTKTRVTLSATDILQLVVTTLPVSLDEMLRGSRRGPVVVARRVALLAWIELGHTLRDMVEALGISPSGASRLLTRPHDVREVRAGVVRVLAAISTRQGKQAA